MQLTPRQQNEVAYHAQHATRFEQETAAAVEPALVANPRRKWWNHHWVAYSILRAAQVHGRNLLVPGCGAGFDAIHCAKLGAEVTALDLSPDMLRLASDSAARAGVSVAFHCMAAEELKFRDNTFDIVFIRDLLHHCDIPACVSEVLRVAKPGAFVVIDELYTHSALQKARESGIGRRLTDLVRPRIYHGEEPYITPDERKIDQSELRLIRNALTRARCRYFNTVVNRFVTDADYLEVVDRVFTRSIGPLGRLVSGRILLTGYVGK